MEIIPSKTYIQRCIQLAKMGKGNVAPNPMVGAVIVHDGKIIGEGYHEKYGEAHAEVNAVNSVEDKSLLKESTIYVSLEPCAHFGKTPPCAELLVKHQFKKVVIGCSDSHDRVAGKGVQILKSAGIEVELGVLENECRALNKAFFTFHEQKRPFVLLKWAQTPNGFIDNSEGKDGEVSWISTPETQSLVHQWRSESQAILVGKNTVLADNPSLTVRKVTGRNPIRILLDKNLEVPIDKSIFNDESRTIILNASKTETIGTNEYIQINDFSIQSILSHLHSLNIQSVLVEGGAKTLQSFIDAKLWDETKIIIGKNEFESGTKAPKLTVLPTEEVDFFGDRILSFNP